MAYKIQNLDDIMKNVETNVSVQTKKIDEFGVEKGTSTGISMALAYILGFLMYMLVFIFGAQVMRGVIEEKTSRVVEVIISSVKPIQLMMGKIIGIALVGLTQFLIWVFLTIGIVGVLKTTILSKSGVEQLSQSVPQNLMSGSQQVSVTAQSAETSPQIAEFTRLFDNAMNQPWGEIIICFIFYFVTGYLLYASVFAAIGSAVDNETETQQFMLPVTIPIILGLMVAMGTMQNPESSPLFLVLDDPAYFTNSNDGPDTFWRSILANSNINDNNAWHFRCICLDGGKSLQDRHTYVWKENFLERDVEVA